MRITLKNTTAVAMVAGAALALAACGHKTEETNISENTTMTDMNAMAPAEGSMNDMSAADNGTDMNMADNSMMGDNSSNMM